MSKAKRFLKYIPNSVQIKLKAYPSNEQDMNINLQIFLFTKLNF